MKRLSLIMIVIWCVIGLAITTSLVLSVILLNGKGDGYMPFSPGLGKANMRLAVDKTIPAREINMVKLAFSADDCTVYPTNGEDITIKHYVRSMPEGRHVKIESSGGVLTVSTVPSFFLEFSLFGFTSRSVIEIYLPQAYNDALSADIKSGVLRFDGSLDLSELSVHVSSGTIQSGYAVKAPDVDVSVTSGSVKLTGGVEADNYAVKANSGTIVIGGALKGSGSVTATSGTIKLSGVDITESLKVKASSGTISIGIAGNPGLNFSGRQSSGALRTYFPLPKGNSTFAETVGEAPYKDLDVTVTSGTIRITQE